jgi:hypothetical protein
MRKKFYERRDRARNAIEHMIKNAKIILKNEQTRTKMEQYDIDTLEVKLDKAGEAIQKDKEDQTKEDQTKEDQTKEDPTKEDPTKEDPSDDVDDMIIDT